LKIISGSCESKLVTSKGSQEPLMDWPRSDQLVGEVMAHQGYDR